MNIKLISTLAITLAFITSSIHAADNKAATPNFIKVGKTYRTAIGMVELTFEVLEMEGLWIKVKHVKGMSKRDVTGAIWLNLQELPIIIEGAKETKKNSINTSNG